VSRLLTRWMLRRRMGEAREAEEEAEILLRSKGFKIIDRQRRATILTYIDGKPNISYVQADFIVEKKGKTFVAEVKTGEFAPDIMETNTRRQLLEYDFVYKPDGILLVDMVERRIKEVEFGLPEERKEKFAVLIVGTIFILIILGLIWLFIQVRLF
jgi:hypothetical protein